jgi:hypothetical protein
MHSDAATPSAPARSAASASLARCEVGIEASKASLLHYVSHAGAVIAPAANGSCRHLNDALVRNFLCLARTPIRMMLIIPISMKAARTHSASQTRPGPLHHAGAVSAMNVANALAIRE